MTETANLWHLHAHSPASTPAYTHAHGTQSGKMQPSIWKKVQIFCEPLSVCSGCAAGYSSVVSSAGPWALFTCDPAQLQLLGSSRCPRPGLLS